MKQLLVLLLLVSNFNLAYFAGFESISNLNEVPIESVNWCYDEIHCNEPTWKDNCRRETTGSPNPNNDYGFFFAQSPVNINTSRIRQGSLSMQCINYESLKGTFRIQFKGYTIQIELENTIYFGEYLLYKYNFHGLHFHWGNKDDVGSEHTINQKSFPLEIHFLIYKQTYKTMDEALASKQWLSVVAFAVLVDVIPLQSGFAGSQVLAPIIKRLSAPDPTVAGTEILNLADLFQSNNYYMYAGTLTTPSCTDVYWNIMERPLLIPKEHLDAIRSFASSSGNHQIRGNNFRPLKSRFYKKPDGKTGECLLEKRELWKCHAETCENTDVCIHQGSRS